MKRFLIVKCSKCGELRVTTGTKTFRCYKCGSLNNISDENKIIHAESAEEARELLIKLKQQMMRDDS
jgi:tRNA(Ile2) C34 agmatinyltransferase TiaS